MSAVKVVLCDRSVIGVLDASLDEFEWLDRESFVVVSEITRSYRYLTVLAVSRFGADVRKMEFVTMDVES